MNQNSRRKSAYETLAFRQVSGTISLMPGHYTGAQLAGFLKHAAVNNFTTLIPGQNPHRVFQLDPSSADAAIVEVSCNGRCPLDEKFIARAYAAGFGVLSDAAGPLLALCTEKFGSVTSLVVLTKLIAENGPSSGVGNHFWRITRPIKANPTLMTVGNFSMDKSALFAMRRVLT